MREDGVQAVVWQTAINPVVALELLASGTWSGAGVLGPEAFDAAPFLSLLADYGSPHGVDERDPATQPRTGRCDAASLPLGGSPSVGMPGIASPPRGGSPSPSGRSSGGPIGSASGDPSGIPVGASSRSWLSARTMPSALPAGRGRATAGGYRPARGAGRDVPDGLRLRGRVRRRLPRRGRASGARGPGHRPDARRRAARRARRRADPAPRAALLPARRAPRRRRPGRRRRAPRGRGPHGRGGPAARRARTTGCSRSPPLRFGGAGGGGRRRAARPTASSRCRRPSTAATSSPRSPRAWRSASRWPTPASRSIPRSSSASSCRAPAPRATTSSAHALAFDRFGNVMLDVEHEELTALGLKLGRRGRWSTATHARYATTFADVPRGRLLLYEDAYRALSLAVNRGSAARPPGPRPRRRGPDRRRGPVTGGAARQRRGCTCARRARRTTAPGSSPPRARRTARSSRRRSSPPAAGDRAARGRRRPGRALLVSLVLRDPPDLLPLLAAVAVADVVAERLAEGDVTIKWPNDVLVDGRKVAGILAEGRPQEGWAVLGIGINVAIASGRCPRSCATRRRRWGSSRRDVEPVLARAPRRARALAARRRRRRVAAWRERDALRGREVAWAAGSGLAAGVDGAGRLVVELPGGGRRRSTPARCTWRADRRVAGCTSRRSAARRRRSAVGRVGARRLAAVASPSLDGSAAGALARERLRLGSARPAPPAGCLGSAAAFVLGRRRLGFGSASAGGRRASAPRRPWRASGGAWARPRPRRLGGGLLAAAPGGLVAYGDAGRRLAALPAPRGRRAAAAASSVSARRLDRLGWARRPRAPRRQDLRRLARPHAHRQRGRVALLAPPAVAAAPALGEVAQQLARERARLARHPRPRAAQHLLGLRRVRHGGGEQRRAQAAVLLARGVDEPPRVARVRAAGGVHEQPEQALGLRPALHGVLLVDLARVLGQAPDPRVGLVAAADALLGQRLQHDLRRLAALLARPVADDVDRQVERLGVARRGDLLQRAQAQLGVPCCARPRSAGSGA